MTKLDRRTLLVGLGAASVSACMAPMRVGEVKREPEGGIGGTGIVGTLTDFGSLVINGLVVELTDGTRVTDAFGAVEASALGIGQALTIEAAMVDGSLSAQRVHVTHPVIGTVSAVEASGKSAMVAGIRVVMERAAIGALVAGQRVAVSGLWQNDLVVASRIDPVDPTGPDVIAGAVRLSRGEGLRIGGQRILGLAVTPPADGSFATFIGQGGTGGFVARDFTGGRFTGAAGPISRLSIEGYLEPADTAPFFAISGLGHSFDEAAKLAPLQARRAVFNGPYDGTFVVDHGLVVPDDLAERRDLIAGLVAGQAAPEKINTR